MKMRFSMTSEKYWDVLAVYVGLGYLLAGFFGIKIPGV